MAIDISCYSTKPVSDVVDIIRQLKREHPFLFDDKFLISKCTPPTALSEEVARDFGMDAVSSFTIFYNDKEYVELGPKVIELIKSYFNKDEILVLFLNEEKM